MTVLTVLAVLENTVPSFYWQRGNRDGFDGFGGYGVVAVSVVTDTPLKTQPPFSVSALISWWETAQHPH